MVNYKKYFLIYALAYLAVVLINLTSIPIAWVDESMLIDPIYNFYTHGTFSSKIWQVTGTDHIFTAYLPVGSFIHLPFFYLFPPSIFFIRLPWLLLMAGTVYFLYKTLKKEEHLPSLLALALVFIFMHDEGITNAMRSGRVEMPVLFFLSLIFCYMREEKYQLLVFFSLSLLALSHPSMWPICAIISINNLYHQNSRNRLKNLFALVIPVFAYLILIRFNFQELSAQLLQHSSQHRPERVPGNMFYNHFFTLFMPVYKPQPYILLLNMAGFAFSIYRIIKYRNLNKTIIEFCFIITSLFITFSLSPFWRYTPALVYMLFLMIPEMIQEFNISLPIINRKSRLILFILLMFIATPFWIRNAAGIIQHKERSIEPVHTWLDEQIGPHSGKILLIDDAAGHFYAMNRKNVDYTLNYGVHRFHLANYETVFLLTQSKKTFNLELVNTYHLIKNKSFISDIKQQIPALTYEGLRLYKVSTEEELQQLNAVFEFKVGSKN